MASPVDSYWTDAEGEDCHWSDILNDEARRGTTIQSLAAHDTQIRAAALKLSDEEAYVAAEALDDADDESWYYDDKQQVIRDVLKAVASFRKEQKQ